MLTHRRAPRFARAIVPLWAGLLALLAQSGWSQDPAAPPADQIRIVFVGDTLVEREVLGGHWETEIRRRLPGQSVFIRNRGYSADTPAGLSRSSFDPPAKGKERLLAQLRELRPTLVVIGYGMSFSLEHPFDEPEGVAPLVTSLKELLTVVEDELGAQAVILTPTAHTDVGLVPERVRRAHNARLAEIARQLEHLAGDRRGFVDLFSATASGETTDQPLSDNGIHLNEAGYAAVARRVADAIAPPHPQAVDGPRQATLRGAIQRKNELDFHRWRPQNWTYLYGFRKHEQGQNAAEVARLDPLIEQADAAITPLTQPE